jgi:GlpG protein
MRLAGTIPNEADAKRFVDFLYTRQIAAMAEPTHAGDWDIWINEESQLAESKQLFDEYVADPGGEKYRDAPEQAKQKVREVRRRRQRTAGNFIHMKHRWRSPGMKGRRPLTFAIIVVCAGIGLITRFGSDQRAIAPYLYMTSASGPSPQQIAEVYRRLAENPDMSLAEQRKLLDPRNQSLPEIRRGEIWRLVTPILVHQSFFHLLFNMYWLFLLGGMVEDRYGSLWLAWFVLLTAVISNLTQYFWHGPYFGGFSGVGYALFGYVWMKSKFDPAAGLFLGERDVFLMLLWFGVCFTGWVGPIANGAHAGGLIAGVVLGYLPKLLKR